MILENGTRKIPAYSYQICSANCTRDNSVIRDFIGDTLLGCSRCAKTCIRKAQEKFLLMRLRGAIQHNLTL